MGKISLSVYEIFNSNYFSCFFGKTVKVDIYNGTEGGVFLKVMRVILCFPKGYRSNLKCRVGVSGSGRWIEAMGSSWDDGVISHWIEKANRVGEIHFPLNIWMCLSVFVCVCVSNLSFFDKEWVDWIAPTDRVPHSFSIANFFSFNFFITLFLFLSF